VVIGGHWWSLVVIGGHWWSLVVFHGKRTYFFLNELLFWRSQMTTNYGEAK